MSLNVTPEVYFHRHILGTMPVMDLSVLIETEQTWTLFNDPSLFFTIEGQIKSEHNGAGNVSVNIGLSDAVNNLDEGLYEKKLTIITPTGEEKIVIIYLIAALYSTDFVWPSSLHFESVRNVEEAELQMIYISSQDPFEGIILPDFLEVAEENVFPSGRVFKIKPKYFFYTPDPQYSDVILLNFTHFDKSVEVDYIIHSGFDYNYEKPIHFTRDNSQMVFYKSINETTFLRLLTNIKLYDYTGELVNELGVILDVPFLKNRGIINLGRELEPYFDLFTALPDFNKKVNAAYPPMQVSINAQEIKYSDYSIVNQDMLPIQRYLCGRNPVGANNIANPFWLCFRPSDLRYVTAESRIVLQLFKPAGKPIQKINVFLNDVFYVSIAVGTNGFALTLPYFLFASFNVKSINGISPGDVISFQYEGMTLKRYFLVKPPQPHSFKIAYRTVWDTFDIVEFTGPATFGVDYAHDLNKTMRNYVEVTKKIETDGPQKVTINTGWLHKNESFVIDELIRSRRAFLLDNTVSEEAMASNYTSENYGNIELIPITAKIVNHDSDENMISFDVEFEINKRYEDEIYSR